MPKYKTTCERSMDWCHKQGYRVGKVEQRIPNPKHPAGSTSRDLFGWQDIQVFDGLFWIGVQCCSMSTRGAHLKKMQEDPEILEAIEDWCAIHGHRAELWAWRKVKLKRGGKAIRWRFERTDLLTLQT